MPSTSKTLPCIGLRGCVKRESALVRRPDASSLDRIVTPVTGDAEIVASRVPGRQQPRVRQELGEILLQHVANDVGAVGDVDDLADGAFEFPTRPAPFF